eukprot:5639985-Pyramimonas_sp.AAC.1
MWLSLWHRAHSFQKFARVSRTGGGAFSRCGSRLSAAHIRLNNLQEFYGLRAGRFQNVMIALAPRKFVVQNA